METAERKMITVQTTVQAPVSKVWEIWNSPEHITQWCQASDEWHAPYADNDLKVNGKFKTTMAAKDGSMSFDLEGIYTRVEELRLIEYALMDDRKVEIVFEDLGGQTKITETFEMENTHPEELQRGGWQAILESFRNHTEAQ